MVCSSTTRGGCRGVVPDKTWENRREGNPEDRERTITTTKSSKEKNKTKEGGGQVHASSRVRLVGPSKEGLHDGLSIWFGGIENKRQINSYKRNIRHPK